MSRMIRSAIPLILLSSLALACDQEPSATSSVQANAALLLEAHPELTVTSVDDDPRRLVVAADEDDDTCVYANETLLCIAGAVDDEDDDESPALGLTTPERDRLELPNQECIYVDGYLYCSGGGGGGGGGGGDASGDCGPCRPRASSPTGYAEYCPGWGYVACEP